MEFSLWLLYIVTFASALIIPGPNAAYGIAQTLSNGAKFGLVASAGFAIASGINIVIVMTGLGLVLSQFSNVLIYMKWVGVCYLLFMAVKAFRANAEPSRREENIKSSRVFLYAVMVSLSNPKVVLINIMLLPLFLVPEKSMVTQGIVLTLTGVVLSFLVYSSYALFASKFISKLKTTTANKVVGSAYACAAAALATIQK